MAVLETIGIRTVFDPRTHHERTHSRIGYPIDPPTATMRLADGAPSASTKPRTPTVDDFSA